MKIEVIAIGSEILAGHVVNTNASFISRILAEEGFTITRHLVVEDDRDRIKEELTQGLGRSDVVIVTGGLGPTVDDLTPGVAAEIFESGFSYNEKVAADLKERYGDQLLSLRHQATLPDKALVLKNRVGTASGLVFENESSCLILLPGVPPEMELLMTAEVLPYLNKRFSGVSRRYSRSLNLFGMTESAIDPTIRELQNRFKGIDWGIYPTQGTLTVRLSCFAENEESAKAKLEPPLNFLFEKFGTQAFSGQSGKIEEAIQKVFIERGLTLSSAESCTGGSIAARLTRLPGASGYFLGSIVSYSNKIKTKLLSVPEELIEEKGAVSEEVVRLMALGVIHATGSDYGIAISGIAGPSGGSAEKPVGTVFAAVARKGHEPRVLKFFIPRNRPIIIERSATLLLIELLKEIQ